MIGLSAFLTALGSPNPQWDETSTVGISSTENHIILPNSQTLTPSGETTELIPRPVALVDLPVGCLARGSVDRPGAESPRVGNHVRRASEGRHCAR